MKYFKRFLLMPILLAFSHAAFAQSDSTPKVSVLTADSLASGNYKDVFTSFFQFAINDLIGPQKEIAFASNPFAIMARANPKLLVDTSYLKYRHLRDFNFNFDVKLDSAYHLSGFSFGVKYALINARDNTISKDFIVQAIKDQNDFATFNNLMGAELSKAQYSTAFKEKASLQIHDWENNDNDSVSFSNLSSDVQAFVDTVVAENHLTNIQKLINENPDLNFRKESQKSYQQLKDEWLNKPLWTIAANGTFKPNYIAANGDKSNVVLNSFSATSEFLVGITSPHNSMKLELDLLAQDMANRDSTSLNQNLLRNIFTFEPGVNFVLKSRENGRSFLEFKISGSYYHVFSDLYPSEKADSSTINGELRVRIINDIWIPVTIKYDPQHGNVFGFLNVRANFTGLKNIMKAM